VRRRDFIKVIGCSAAVWPLAAHAQQPEQMRRIGVLMSDAAEDSEGQARLTAFVQALQQLGWTDGRNARIDIRWGAADSDRYRKYAAELVALAPDVILATTTPTVAALQQATRTVPMVFAGVIDPVGAGFVSNLAQPGGNTTGFALYEYGISGKWLALLKEIAPNVTRAAIVRDPSNASGIGQLGAIQAVAPSLAIEITPLDVRDESELERAVTQFARKPNGGVIITASPTARINRRQVIALVAQHRLPTVYPFRYFVSDGGLVCYGPNVTEQYRLAADYVSRILKGEKPAEMPVQAPTKYELLINLKTAKALGLTVPPTLLARADEVIE
jgi:putative ABC transport system substrate-binding protein